MGSAEQLTKDLVEVVKNEDFTEAVVTLEDGTRLYFCHRVGERWAKSVGPEMQEDEGGLASALLQQVAIFRLNSKHLDVAFQDGSRWDYGWETD